MHRTAQIAVNFTFHVISKAIEAACASCMLTEAGISEIHPSRRTNLLYRLKVRREAASAYSWSRVLPNDKTYNVCKSSSIHYKYWDESQGAGAFRLACAFERGQRSSKWQVFISHQLESPEKIYHRSDYSNRRVA